MIALPAGANPLAYLALLGFLPFAYVVFGRFRPHVATLIVIMAGELFLPLRSGFDLPLLPSIGRNDITYVSVALCMLFRHPAILRNARFGTGLEILGLVAAVGLLGTTVTNLDPIQYGSRIMQPMDFVEAITGCMSLLISYALPVFIGRALIRSGEAMKDLLVAVAIGGLIYIPIILVELRISPQFNYLIYGYQSPQFAYEVRYSGFRPFGFMVNGLALAIFMVASVGAAAGLRKAGLQVIPFRRIPARKVISRFAAPVLLGILLLCKSIAAAVFGVVEWLVIVLLRPRGQIRVALALGVFLLSYPVLRATDVFPTEVIVARIAQIDEQRALSLAARFENEDGMLAHARDRIIFGWGGYARNWVIDPETGENLTIPDGHWVITISAYGLVGFLSAFLIFLIPLISSWRYLSSIRSERVQTLVAACALIMAFRSVDLIPNGLFSHASLFMAGALQGTVYWERSRSRSREVPVRDGIPSVPLGSRQPAD